MTRRGFLKGFAAGAAVAATPQSFAEAVRQGWTSPRVVKTLCLPSTGHWGDIGWALMRTDGDKARVELHQRDFWFPIKNSPEPGADHEMWRLNTAENKGATCTFTLHGKHDC